jgi:hypothetical protein
MHTDLIPQAVRSNNRQLHVIFSFYFYVVYKSEKAHTFLGIFLTCMIPNKSHLFSMN